MSTILETKTEVKEVLSGTKPIDVKKVDCLELAKLELEKLQKEVSEILGKPESFNEFKEFLSNHAKHPSFKEISEFAIFVAIEKNKLKEVEHLLTTYKVSLNCQDKKESNTPVHHACGYGSVEMVKFLVEYLQAKFYSLPHFLHRKWNINNYTTLAFAISRKRKDIISYLKSLNPFGFLVQTMDYYIELEMEYCFIKAVLEGDDMEMLEYLYKYYPNSIAKLRPPIIFMAVEAESLSGMNCILKHDPDALKLKDSFGSTPFSEATRKGNVPIMEYIYNRYPETIKQKNAWPLLCRAARSGCLQAFEFIVNHDKDAFADRFSWISNNPLFDAVNSGSIPILEFLLNQSPIKKQQAVLTKDCVETAANQGHLNAVKYLLSQGIKYDYVTKEGKVVYATTTFRTSSDDKHRVVNEYLKQVESIFDAAKFGKLSDIKKWVENGNTLNLKDYTCNSLLHIAMEYNQKDVALYLLEQGLSKELLNEADETPFSKALRLGNIKTLVEIFKYRADKINETSEDKKIAAERIKELQTEFETLIQKVEARNFKVDHEALALEYDKKYWLVFAKEVVNLKKTPEIHNNEIRLKEYLQKNEKLGELIYGGHILCKENDNGELSFEIPDAETREGLLHSEEQKETKDEREVAMPELDSSEEARQLRLKWAMNFAIEGQNFASAMRILLETSQAASSVGEVSVPSQKAQDVKSPKDFIMLFMASTYKPKLKIVKKDDKPKKDEYSL